MQEVKIKQITDKTVYHKQKSQQSLEAKVGQQLLALQKTGHLLPAPENPWIS